MSQISKEEYLKEDFDYTKLTKQELRSIMSENNVENIPPITALKQVILDAYKSEIHSQIKELRAKFNNENIFQISMVEEIGSDKEETRVSDENLGKRNNSSVENLSAETGDKFHIKNKSRQKDKSKAKAPGKEKNRNNSFFKDVSFSNSHNNDVSPDEKMGYDRSFSKSHGSNMSFSSNSFINTPNGDDTIKLNRNNMSFGSNSFVNASNGDDTIKLNRNNMSFSSNSFINTPTEDEIIKLKNEQMSSKDKFKDLSENKMLKENLQNTKFLDSLKSFHANKSMVNCSKGNSLMKNPEDVANTTNKFQKKIKWFFKWSTRSLLILILSLYLYLRVFCPYCGTGQPGFCVPLPRNTFLDEDYNLVPKKGYKLVNSFIRYCVIDNSELTEKKKKINAIVKMLEQIRGKQNYGFDTHLKIRLDSLVDSDSLRLSLLNDKRVIVENGFVCAKRGTVTLRILLKYYLFKLSKIALPVLLGILFVKYLLYEQKKKQMFHSQANLIAREVFDVLMRQLVSSSKTSIFKNYVYELQLKEALEIKDTIWETVKNIVESNSNVLTEKDEMNKTKWSWIGPIIKKNLVDN